MSFYIILHLSISDSLQKAQSLCHCNIITYSKLLGIAPLDKTNRPINHSQVDCYPKYEQARQADGMSPATSELGFIPCITGTPKNIHIC